MGFDNSCESWLRPLLENCAKCGFGFGTIYELMTAMVCPIVNAPAGRLLGAYDLGVATPRALVHAGDKTSEDARSWYMISVDAKSWVMTQSAGRPAAAPPGGGMGNNQGVEVNEGVDGVLDFSTIIAHQLQNLLPTMLAQVGNQGSNQGDNRNQSGTAVNDNIRGNVRNVTESNDRRVCTYKEFLACNPKEYDGKGVTQFRQPPIGDELNTIRTLGVYCKPSHEGYRNTIELPVMGTTWYLFDLTPFGWCKTDALSFLGASVPDPNQRASRISINLDLALYDNESWYNPRDFAKPVKAIALPQDVSSTSDRRLIELENQVEKALLDFDSNQEKTLSHLRTQLGQQQDDMIGKINLFWKSVSKKLNDVSTPKNAGNSMAHKSIAAISNDEKEELRKNGIKSPSKLFSLKYLSPASIKELNKNTSAPKRIHFVNSIVILSTYSDTKKEDISSTNAHEHELGNMVRRGEEVKEQGKEEDEIETDVEVEDVIEEEESRFETDEEVEEIFEEEEEDEDDENFNSFLTIKELSHHECFAYEFDFMILEDTTSIIDRHLREMVFGRPFIDETDLVYNEEEGTVMFDQDDEKITFKMPHTMEIFYQTRLMGLSTDSIPPSAYEENFGHGRTHYYQSLLIGDKYKQDRGDREELGI
ncbi:hypothetical protein Tco_0745984 [Tanacetum coccineum]